MGVIDNQKYALMICDMFYNQNLTQKEISGILNISRPQVCRIISHAKNEGWITISFNYPNSEESEFEKRLRDLYGLNEVFVFDTGVDDDDDLSLERLAFKCSDIFDLFVKDKSRVGVMAGRTIRAFSQAIPQTKNRGIEFVPLCGGFTSNGIEWYANSNVQLLASKTAGKFYSFNAPSCVSSMELKTMLLSEDSIKEVTKLWDTCDVTIVGIGTANANSSNVLAGNLKEEDAKFLIKQGAVASCCCSYLTSSGREIHNSVTDRFIGASINQIKKSMTIAMAIGSEKVPAIHASFEAHAGQILGIFGLGGSGRTELLESIYGLRVILSGDVQINGNAYLEISPKNSLRNGMILISEDRRGAGLVSNLSVAENIVLSTLANYQDGLILNSKREKADAEEKIDELSIKTTGISQPVRAAVLPVRDEEYIEAARVSGVSDFKIIFQHVLPSSLSPIIVQVTMGVANGILSASFLSFLGLGVPVPAPEWGEMLSSGREYIRDYGFLTTYPGIATLNGKICHPMCRRE